MSLAPVVGGWSSDGDSRPSRSAADHKLPGPHTMNRLSARTAFALLLAAPLASHATEIAAGTAEYVTARDCIAGPTSACDDVSPIVMSQYGGNGGAFSSAATETFAGYGSASGSVSLSGTIG